jgi:hypothetical protein
MREVLGWPRLLVIAGVLNAASAIWFFTQLPALEVSPVGLAAALAAVGALCGVTHSLIAGLICALFPTSIRQSGFAFPYSLGTAVISGLTPLTVAWLVRSLGLAVPMWQEILAGLLAFALAWSLRFLPLYLGGDEAHSPGPALQEAVGRVK